MVEIRKHEVIGGILFIRDSEGRRYDRAGNRVYFNQIIADGKTFAYSYVPPPLINGKRINDYRGYIPEDANLHIG